MPDIVEDLADVLAAKCFEAIDRLPMAGRKLKAAICESLAQRFVRAGAELLKAKGDADGVHAGARSGGAGDTTPVATPEGDSADHGK